jgi:hypothetical protein
MAISGQSGLSGAAGGQGGLEAFMKLRHLSREKFALPESGMAPAGAPPTQGNEISQRAKASKLNQAVTADAFAEAKAGILKMAGHYQRNGAAEKIQERPRLGQFVDFRA